MNTQTFTTKVASRDELIKASASGAANIGRLWVSEVVNRALGATGEDMFQLEGTPSKETIFAYMCRRFGFPTEYCDDYKQMAEWYLTTPMPNVWLTVYPYPSCGFGYMSTREITQRIHEEERKPITEYHDRFVAWALAEHGVSVFSVLSYDWFGLEVERVSDTHSRYISSPMYLKAVDEYNQWQKDNNLPDVSQEEEMERWFGDFRKMKEAQIKNMRALYDSVETRPDEGESQTLNEMTAALIASSVDLLRYTNVRDVYFNIFGDQTDEMDTKLKLLHPEETNEDGDTCHPGMYVDYSNPNTYIEVYQRGLSIKEPNDETCDATGDAQRKYC